MARILLQLGLVVLALSLLMLLLGVMGWVGGEQIAGATRIGLLAGGICVALGILLALLGKAGGLLARRTCARCNAPVRKGATYCPDHLKEAIQEAQDHLHGQRGSGI